MEDAPALFYREMREAGILGIIQASPVPIRALYDRKNLMQMDFDNLPTCPDIKLDEHQYAVIEQKAKERRYFQLEFDIRNHFKPGPVKYHNVLGIIRGSKYPDEYVMSGGHLVDKVVKLHEPLLRGKNIALRNLLPEPIFVHADENLITQVVINLVKNAIEAVEAENHEKIVISISRQESEKISLHVANSGHPIPAEILPHIFIPFFTTKSSGSGIGLSVSRYIMRLHGGKLQHTRSKDGMTVFSLVF